MAYLIKNDSLSWQKGHLVLELVEDNFRFYTEDPASSCPEDNGPSSSYTITYTIWLYPAWGGHLACAQTMADGREYYPWAIGRSVFTKLGAGNYYHIDDSDPSNHQMGSYTTACVTPPLSDASVIGTERIYWDSDHWRIEHPAVWETSNCSPVGSYERSNGFWYYTAEIT